MLRTIFLTIFTLYATAQAQELKAIFDCSSKDASYIDSRMMLIEKTMDMIKEDKDKVNFVLTIHGECIKAASKNYADMIEIEDVAHINNAQKTMERISKKGVKIIACAIALSHYKIDQKDVLPFMKISKNSYIDLIKYQNQGYALMPLK